MEIDYKNKDVKDGLDAVTYINDNWKYIKDPTDPEPRGWFEYIQEKQTPKVFAIIKIHMKNGLIAEFKLNKAAYKWFKFFKKMRLGI